MKKYEDIIGLSRPVSKKHPPMSRENRAAQFAPFAALTGFEGAIKETARVTGEKIELDETQKTFLDEIRALETKRSDFAASAMYRRSIQ